MTLSSLISFGSSGCRTLVLFSDSVVPSPCDYDVEHLLMGLAIFPLCRQLHLSSIINVTTSHLEDSLNAKRKQLFNNPNTGWAVAHILLLQKLHPSYRSIHDGTQSKTQSLLPSMLCHGCRTTEFLQGLIN